MIKPLSLYYLIYHRFTDTTGYKITRDKNGDYIMTITYKGKTLTASLSKKKIGRTLLRRTDVGWDFLDFVDKYYIGSKI